MNDSNGVLVLVFLLVLVFSLY
uniref:Uncharacterized protein n=1 Tax=Anguilla anguilla TaxID=7936 RepID=A0A0E9S1E6_ANGAN